MKTRTLKPETNGAPDLKVMLAEARTQRIQTCVEAFTVFSEVLKKENCQLHITMTMSRLKGIQEQLQILAND